MGNCLIRHPLNPIPVRKLTIKQIVSPWLLQQLLYWYEKQGPTTVPGKVAQCRISSLICSPSPTASSDTDIIDMSSSSLFMLSPIISKNHLKIINCMITMSNVMDLLKIFSIYVIGVMVGAMERSIGHALHVHHSFCHRVTEPTGWGTASLTIWLWAVSCLSATNPEWSQLSNFHCESCWQHSQPGVMSCNYTQNICSESPRHFIQVGACTFASCEQE